MSNTRKFSLGGVEYTLPEKPILGELRQAGAIMLRPVLEPNAANTHMATYDQALELICMAMKRSNPDLTPEKFLEQSIEEDELWQARRVILRHFKMLKEQETPTPGEAKAEPHGDGSTESSAPA